MAKVAINGLGRIGRAAFKTILDTPALELVAVNDLVPIDNLVYLLKYDTVYGKYEKRVSGDDKNLIVEGKKYRVFTEKDPAQLPRGELGIENIELRLVNNLSLFPRFSSGLACERG
jgi:glyceraldehyde 3-phosphate dehydrogenase